MIIGLTEEQKNQIAEEIIMQTYAYIENTSISRELDSEKYHVLLDFCYCLAQVFDGKDSEDRKEEQRKFIRKHSMKVLQGGK